MEARQVEEALIAHFGPAGAERNDHDPDKPGQLRDLRHEISPFRPDYCASLMIGQFVLDDFGYGAYAGAHYTRGRVCPGIGGLR
ncbi:MAG: hypothetical protein JWQ18_2385 [Conexibacter sp.]|nr:hypothetical protein [Conexibacter sp.]